MFPPFGSFISLAPHPSSELIQQNSIFQRQTIAFNHSLIHSLLNISPHFHQAFSHSETFLLYSTPVQSSRCKCSFIATVCIRATDTTPAAIVPLVISRLQCIDYVAMTASIHGSIEETKLASKQPIDRPLNHTLSCYSSFPEMINKRQMREGI